MSSLPEPTPCRTQPRRAGFSLLELSVVTVIMSIVAVMGLEVVAAYMNRTAYRVTAERLDVVDQAIARYARIYNRLPCPARRTEVLTDSCYGKEANGSGGAGTCANNTGACNAAVPVAGLFFGNIPVRDLGLPLNMMLDGYGNRMYYAVTQNQVYNTTYHATNNFTQTPDAIIVRSGKIDQSCGGAGQLCQNRGTASYFLFSVGADKRGGYTPQGTGSTCSTSVPANVNGMIDSVNCRSVDSPGTLQKTGGVNISPALSMLIFYDSRFNAGSQEYSHFDDVVKWRSKGGM